MAQRFYISTKPLHKAKPYVLQLIREGGTEWWEGVKPGQLFHIDTGRQKSYIDLDNSKIRNLNDSIEVMDEDQEKELNKKLPGHIILEERKLKNLDKKKKPVFGFVAYEKEFVAYPVNVVHDGTRICYWLDAVKKNIKDLFASRLKASQTLILYIGIIIIIGIAVYFFARGKWGEEPAKTVVVQGLWGFLPWKKKNI